MSRLITAGLLASTAILLLMPDAGGAGGPGGEPSAGDVQPPDRGEMVKRAVMSLDDANDDHWTQAGLPAMAAVEKAAGDTTITRAEVDVIGRVRVVPGDTPSVEPADPPAPDVPGTPPEVPPPDAPPPPRVVAKGDEVLLHGRAIVDGQTIMPAVVTGVSDGERITARVVRANGQSFDVAGVATKGDLGDGSNWWEWPASDIANSPASA